MKKLTKKMRSEFSHGYVLADGTLTLIFKQRIKSQDLEFAWVYPKQIKLLQVMRREDLYFTSLAIADYLLNDGIVLEWYETHSDNSKAKGIYIEAFSFRPEGTFEHGLTFLHLPGIILGDVQPCHQLATEYTGEPRIRGYVIDRIFEEKEPCVTQYK